MIYCPASELEYACTAPTLGREGFHFAVNREYRQLCCRYCRQVLGYGCFVVLSFPFKLVRDPPAVFEEDEDMEQGIFRRLDVAFSCRKTPKVWIIVDIDGGTQRESRSLRSVSLSWLVL